MPELPEVETIRRDLERELPGRRVLRVRRAATVMLRTLSPALLSRHATGARFGVPLRHGKLLRLPLEGGAELWIHLGMSGRLGVEAAGAAEETHTHLVLTLEGGRELRFRDPRRFGRVALHVRGRTHGLTFGAEGVDPLDPAFDAARLETVLSRSRAEIKRVLLDQSKIAGLGNIYVCEAMFRSGIHPARAAQSLRAAEVALLHQEIGAVLQMALTHRGTTLVDYRDAGGNKGGFQARLLVYGREGQPCATCGGAIERSVQAMRSTFFCRRCQPRRPGRVPARPTRPVPK